jgi:hypothetical protein
LINDVSTQSRKEASEMKFTDRSTRDNNIVEVGGIIAKTTPLDWGGFVTLECEHSGMMFSHPDLCVVGDGARELLWLPDRQPVLVRAHIQNYEPPKDTGSNGWRVEVDTILSDRSTSLVEEARFDQNMVRLLGEVMRTSKMSGSRLKVVLLCREKYHEPCVAEVVMHRETLKDVTKGKNIGVLAYLEMGNRRNPKTRAWYPYKSIKVLQAWMLE